MITQGTWPVSPRLWPHFWSPYELFLRESFHGPAPHLGTWSLWALLLQKADHQQTPEILQSLPFLGAGVTGIGGPCPGGYMGSGTQTIYSLHDLGFSGFLWVMWPPGRWKQGLLAFLLRDWDIAGSMEAPVPWKAARTPLHLGCSQTRRPGCLYTFAIPLVPWTFVLLRCRAGLFDWSFPTSLYFFFLPVLCMLKLEEKKKS